MSNMETQLNILANFFFNLLLAERSQFIADCIDEDIKGIYGKKDQAVVMAKQNLL